jgi:Protein of unknown function (DUF2939)
MTKLVLLALALFVVGFLAWLYWSPRHAAEQLQEAARTNDTASIRRLVDFPALRQNVQIEIQTPPTQARAQAPAGSALAKCLDGLNMVRVASPANWLASPRGLAATLRGADSAKVVQRSMAYEKYPKTFGLLLSSNVEGQLDTVRFLFERKGLAWRMDRIKADFRCANAPH